ncbi:MAG: dtd D-tyrosyl-tRNA(Tyr) deacylase [Acidobacteria bacterium]|nr:dtd D-tyrosyl-tRNA(Tyr) deacylase [Acidobacteriota bacterium]
MTRAESSGVQSALQPSKPQYSGDKADMRAVIQRVDRGRVKVGDSEIASIGRGILALVAFGREDSAHDLEWMARKIVELRIFDDEAGRLNLGLLDIGGQLLVVSQFTLYGDCRKGRRPSYSDAAPPSAAQALYEDFVSIARTWIPDVQCGRFQAEMEVELVNSGPVTLILDSRWPSAFRSRNSI